MKNMYCELLCKECPFTLDDEIELYCTHGAECPELGEPEDPEYWAAEYKQICVKEAEDYVRSLKDTMQAAWNEYDMRMKNKKDAELSDSYFEAEMTLKDCGIEFNPSK